MGAKHDRKPHAKQGARDLRHTEPDRIGIFLKDVVFNTFVVAARHTPVEGDATTLRPVLNIYLRLPPTRKAVGHGRSARPSDFTSIEPNAFQSTRMNRVDTQN